MQSVQSTHGLLLVLHETEFFYITSSQLMEQYTCNCHAQNRHDVRGTKKGSAEMLEHIAY